MIESSKENNIMVMQSRISNVVKILYLYGKLII